MRISRSRLMGENRSINVKLRLPPLCHQPQHNTSSHFTTTTNIIVIHNTYCCAITTMTTTSTATQYIIMPISHTHTDNMKPQLRRKIHPETTLNNNHQHNCIFLVGFFIILLIIFQEIVLQMYSLEMEEHYQQKEKKYVYKFSPVSSIRKMSFNTIRYGCGGIMGML